MKKLGIVFGVVFVAAAVWLGSVSWKDYRAQQERTAQREETEKMLRPLEVQLNELQQELSDMEEEYSYRADGSGTAEVLFTEPDVRVYEEIYPIMQEMDEI